MGEGEDERKDCEGCGTPHHADCYAENGGCTVFGCANAPSDEAKVTVSGTDLMGNTVVRQVPAGAVPVGMQPGVATNPTIGAVAGPVAGPAPGARPAFLLNSGYTTFRAPALVGASLSVEASTSGSRAGPPPPPPIAGTGIAPPPQARTSPQAQTAQNSLANYYLAPAAKTRVIFVLLGIFLGALGVHNFYAGYAKKGAIQLCVTLLSCFYGAVISWPWAIIEICMVNKDADGTRFV